MEITILERGRLGAVEKVEEFPSIVLGDTIPCATATDTLVA